MPRADGKLDIIGAGLDTIFAAAVPVQHPRIVVAVRTLLSLEDTARDHALDVSLQTAAGDQLAHAHGDLPPAPPEALPQLPPSGVGVLMVLQFENVVFSEYGVHEFTIVWD